MQSELVVVHIDLPAAMDSFWVLLEEQAKLGEVSRPAKPENRAIYRELAPFRLMEYEFLTSDPEITLGSAYLAFADGTVLAVGEDVPESLVDRLVRIRKPAFLYLVLHSHDPLSPGQAAGFLSCLTDHLGRSLVGWCRGSKGAMVVGCYPSLDWDEISPALSHKAETLADTPLLTHAQLMDAYQARLVADDGRCWARITIDFVQYMLVFDSVQARDAFIDWTQAVSHKNDLLDQPLGVVLPAFIASKPGEEVPCIDGVSPCAVSPSPMEWLKDQAAEAELAAARQYWNSLQEAAKAIENWP